MRHARLTTFAVAVVAAVWMAMPQLAARQAAPGAPTGLSYVVGPGGSLQLLWTHATGHVHALQHRGRGRPRWAALPGPAHLEFRQSRSVLEAPRAAQLVQRQRHRPGRLLRAHPRRQRRRAERRRATRSCCRYATAATRLARPPTSARSCAAPTASCSGTRATAAGRRRRLYRPRQLRPERSESAGAAAADQQLLQPRDSAGQLLRARRGGERLRHERAVERDRGHRPGQHARDVAESAAGPAAAASVRARPGVPVRRRSAGARLPESLGGLPAAGRFVQRPVPARGAQDAAQRLHRPRRVEAAHDRQALRLQRQADPRGGARRSSPATRSPITTARTPRKARPTSTWWTCSAATAPASAWSAASTAATIATPPTTACSTTSSAAGRWRDLRPRRGSGPGARARQEFITTRGPAESPAL